MMRLAGILAVLLIPVAAAADEVALYAAGSLKAALGEVARDFEKTAGHRVKTTFAPSGLLRQRVEEGEPADVFASANMEHPTKLNRNGLAGPVSMFARNKLCAIAQPGVVVNTTSLLDVLLNPKTRVGTSTPKADPSGDYAWELFRKANKVRAGAFGILDSKAMKLTGGRGTTKAPKDRNLYGWIMESNKADLFLTYCTNAVRAKKEVPSLKIVTVPEALSVDAEYGVTVLKGAPKAAEELKSYILSADGRKVLAQYGFDAP